MMDLSKSSFLFDLIEEFEIFDKSGTPQVFTDESYNSFCAKYKAQSIERDIALYKHINSTPNLFRIHMPHSKWVLSIVPHLVWYYDELILSDPVLQLVKSEIGDIEQRKNWLQESLTYVKKFKESIDGGFLLFAGDNMIPYKTGLFDSDSKMLIDSPQVLKAFERITAMGQKPSPINDNPADNLTQLEITYDGMWGNIRKLATYFPDHVLDNPEKLKGGIYYDFLTKYEILTKKDLERYDKLDVLGSLKEEYVKDISVVLETLTNAQRLNLPVLFYRDVDRLTAKNYSNSSNELFANTTVYDCTLPYVNGIPSERLFDIRNEIPDAFLEFRAFLYDLVDETMTKTNDKAEFKHILDTKLKRTFRQLETEMKNARNKWRFQGIGVPMAILSGSLTMYSSGIDYTQLLATLTGSGGIVKGLATWNNVKALKGNAALNPTYFLWKAQQSKT